MVIIWLVKIVWIKRQRSNRFKCYNKINIRLFMLINKKSLAFLVVAILFVAFIIGSPFIVNKIFAQNTSTGPLTGWAWSSNIGWIKFHSDSSDPLSFGVQLNADGSLSGQAWSSNIGWINFDNLGSGPDGQAGASLLGSSIKGWGRACSVFESGCSGNLKNNIYRGDWDGWLQMGPRTATNGWPGVSIVGNQLTGFAWGNEILGWVKFDGVTSGTCTGVCVGAGLSLQCQVTNSTPKVGDTVQFFATPSNGHPSYSYKLNIDGPVSWGSEAGEYNLMSGPASSGDWKLSAPGEYVFRAEIKDNSGATATCSTAVNVAGDEPQLNVSVIGAGKVTGSGISCGNGSTTCSQSYSAGTEVTLTGRPTDPGTNTVWAGCDNTTAPDTDGVTTCKVTMDSNRAVTATFEQSHLFDLSVAYPSGRSMVVNYQTQNLDASHDSSPAKVTLTPANGGGDFSVRFEVIMNSLLNRSTSANKPSVMPVVTAAHVGDTVDLQIHFPDDSQPQPNIASPYAGNYQFLLKAIPSDNGVKTETIPLNFSYIDLREREQ